jgi:hypothetical protein
MWRFWGRSLGYPGGLGGPVWRAETALVTATLLAPPELLRAAESYVNRIRQSAVEILAGPKLFELVGMQLPAALDVLLPAAPELRLDPC